MVCDDGEAVLGVQEDLVEAVPLQAVLDAQQHAQELAHGVQGGVVPGVLAGNRQQLCQTL